MTAAAVDRRMYMYPGVGSWAWAWAGKERKTVNFGLTSSSLFLLSNNQKLRRSAHERLSCCFNERQDWRAPSSGAVKGVEDNGVERFQEPKRANVGVKGGVVGKGRNRWKRGRRFKIRTRRKVDSQVWFSWSQPTNIHKQRSMGRMDARPWVGFPAFDFYEKKGAGRKGGCRSPGERNLHCEGRNQWPGAAGQPPPTHGSLVGTVPERYVFNPTCSVFCIYHHWHRLPIIAIQIATSVQVASEMPS